MLRHYRVFQTSGLFHSKPNLSIWQKKEVISVYRLMILYTHTHCIYTQHFCLWWFSQGKKKNENLNTAKKLEIVVKSSIVCVLYSFNAIKRFTFDPKDLGARFRNSPNLLQPLHVQSYGFCLQVRISSFKCTISFVLKSLDFCVFTKL